MGLRYVGFRVKYGLQQKAGVLEKKFPINPSPKNYISLEEWKKNTPVFFFQGKEDLNFEHKLSQDLKDRIIKLKNGEVCFFSKSWRALDKNEPWHANPDTGFKYDTCTHWSKVNDYSTSAGDIKFVWEKARFSWLYDMIRYDYHSQEDQAEFVFKEIIDFITKNPINQGPQYKCSQEISLRILNWTFALYYYKNNEALTEEVFQQIMHSIYWQLHHVYHNINFSRIAVRNNHAITETLMLYLAGKLFPFFPNVKEWSKKGKKWQEEEIAYQIYRDGTFLQFSMNYHRVVVQLLTWGIRLSELHQDPFSVVVYDRAKASLNFLNASMDSISGKLPNYGNNDGALFFKLNDNDYQVYRSQLNDLHQVLGDSIDKLSESQFWYGYQLNEIKLKPRAIAKSFQTSFKDGGYYINQEQDVKTFIRCGAYKDRPFQADNNHVDIWYNGVNYFRDAGSYKYNTTLEELDFFMGTKGHNSVKIQGKNQMQRGGRFIWYNWIKKANAAVIEEDKYVSIKCSFEGFKQIKGGIKHHREVKKYKSQLTWEITDTFEGANNLEKELFWHPNPKVINNIELKVTDEEGNPIPLKENKGWYSGYYGHKEETTFWSAKSNRSFITHLKILN